MSRYFAPGSTSRIIAQGAASLLLLGGGIGLMVAGIKNPKMIYLTILGVILGLISAPLFVTTAYSIKYRREQ